MPLVDFDKFLPGWYHIPKWNRLILVEEMQSFRKAMPGKGMVGHPVHILYIRLLLAPDKIYDVLIIDIRVQDHIISANDIIVCILWQYFVRLGKVILEMKAGFMDRNRERMIALIKGHEVIPARKSIFIQFVQSWNILVKLPTEPNEETGFHS